MHENRIITPEQPYPAPHILQKGVVWTPFSEESLLREKDASKITLPLKFDKHPGSLVFERTHKGVGSKKLIKTTLQVTFPLVGLRADDSQRFRSDLSNTVVLVQHPLQDTVLTFPPYSENSSSEVASLERNIPSSTDDATAHTEIVVMTAADFVRKQVQEAILRETIQKQLTVTTDQIDPDAANYDRLCNAAMIEILLPHILTLTQTPISPTKLFDKLGIDNRLMWQLIDRGDLVRTSGLLVAGNRAR